MKLPENRRWQGCVGGIVFLLTLLPRVVGLDAFVTWDELDWTGHSARFLTALSNADFKGTFQIGNPGVTLMWLEAIGLWLNPWAGSARVRELAQMPVTGTPEALRKLADLLFASKFSVAVFVSLGVLLTYLLVKRLFGPRIAILSAILIALDPFHVAHSRVLQLDALTATFMTLSVLSLLFYLGHRSQRVYLAISGSMAGLALLTKTPALFLIPFTGLLLTVACYAKKQALRKEILESIQVFAFWSGIAILVFFLLWPAMWVNPAGTIQGMIATTRSYTTGGHANLNFFRGEIKPDPGPSFYPPALLFRFTPLTTFGLILCGLFLIRSAKSTDFTSGRFRISEKSLIALIAYAILFSAFMSFGAEKFDRYLLPIFPALDITAAAGLSHLIETMSWGIAHLKFSKGLGQGRLFPIAFSLVPLLQAGLVLPYHPYYISYYNPLLGGPGQAPQTLLVGWGEGMEQAARYLNQKEGARGLQVATWVIPSFAPYFVGQISNIEGYNPATVDYFVFYISQVQRDLYPETLHRYYGQQEPEHVVRIHGLDYAWIYRNTHHVDLIRYFESHAQPGDVILLNTPSILTKYYRALPSHVILANLDNDEARIVGELSGDTEGQQRVWYVFYPGAPSDPEGIVRYHLATQGYKFEERSFSDVTVTGYSLPNGASFRVPSLRSLSGVNFEARLALTGYGLSDAEVQWGRDLGVVLRWQTPQRVAEDHTAFVHLVDQEGHIWGRYEKPLQNNSLSRTSGWEAGEEDTERYTLSLLAGTPPGTYQVKLGVYDSNTGQRLNLLDKDGAVIGMEYALGAVEVTRSPFTPPLSQLDIPHPLRQDFGHQVELLGYKLPVDKVKPGEALPLTLYWRALRGMEDDYNLLLQLRDKEGHVWARKVVQPANEAYPTSRWAGREVIRGQYDLPIEASAPSGQAQLLINLVSSEGEPLLEDDFILAGLSVVAPERVFAAPAIPHPLKASLGDAVTLLGYGLEEERMKAGEVLHLTLYWQARGTMDRSYKVFTHLIDERNHVWGQRDSVPVGGARPTTGWVEGEIIVDRYEIPIQADAPAGSYRIEVGMYDPATMERLPSFDENGKRLSEDRVLLGVVRIE